MHSDGIIPPCQCPMAGYCERHKIKKNYHWHYLCQTREDYRELWEDGIGPGQKVSPEERRKRTRKIRKRLNKYRGLWRELHAYQCLDSHDGMQWFKAWLDRVPKHGCDCRRNFDDHLRAFPPNYSSPEAFHTWSVAIHNLVNVQLGKPVWTEATEITTS